MTISASDPLSSGPYTGNGVTTVFDYDFVIYAETELEVIKQTISTGVETTLTLTTHYTVSPTGGSFPAAGTITMVTAPTSDEKIVILPKITRSQERPFSTQGSVSLVELEEAYDKLTSLTLELFEKAGRAVTLSSFSGVGDIDALRADIEVLADIASDISTVAGDTADIGTVAGISSDVSTLAALEASITSLALIEAGITSVAAIEADVSTVAGISGDVSTVAALEADIAAILAGGAISVSGLTISDAAPGITLDETDVSGSDAKIELAAGLLRIRVDDDNNEAGSRIQFFLDGNIVGSWDDAGSFKVGGGAPSVDIDFTTQTGAVGLPRGTTAERPGSPLGGYLRWNSTDNVLEMYDGAGWNEVGGGGGDGWKYGWHPYDKTEVDGTETGLFWDDVGTASEIETPDFEANYSYMVVFRNMYCNSAIDQFLEAALYEDDSAGYSSWRATSSIRSIQGGGTGTNGGGGRLVLFNPKGWARGDPFGRMEVYAPPSTASGREEIEVWATQGRTTIGKAKFRPSASNSFTGGQFYLLRKKLDWPL